jgi:quercetin dioxygenase-like cupin family protein
MIRTLLALAAGIAVGVAGMATTQRDKKSPAKAIAVRDIVEKVDGKEAKVTFVEVTYEAGQAGKPHRHPGPVFGYILEGEYEWAIDDQPAKVFKAGETFYEPGGCLHRVSRSPAGAKGTTRVLAVMLHPRDAKQLSIPEPQKD